MSSPSESGATTETHSHTHAHGDHHDHSGDAEGIIAVFRGEGDKGALVTLLGLLTNVALTIVKGAAGWYLNSAVLIADAGHSLSDLMGDLVTLFFYTLSRRPPSSSYPYGFGKFESLGTSTVAAFLLLGAYAIGGHSYTQLGEAVPGLPSLPFLHLGFSDNHHGHGDDGVPDLNAAWIALLSILVKEGMYRLSSSVAIAENSPVLMANALHHRSDMYSSFVSLVAILGHWFVPSLPLDPIGGLLVSILILHQATELLSGSLYELTDHGLSSNVLEPISQLVSSTSSLKVTNIRGIRRGAHLFIEATVDVANAEKLSVAESVKMEDSVMRKARETRKDIKDIRLRLSPISL